MKQIETEMMRVITESRNNYDKFEASRIVLALNGIAATETGERKAILGRLVAGVRLAANLVSNSVYSKKESRRRAQRVYYLKQRIAELEDELGGTEGVAPPLTQM